MTETRFSPPEGFSFGGFTNFAGAFIRTGHAPAGGPPRGVIILLPGFREPIEKYFEVMRDFTRRGFEVHAMDWRGQGGSDRFLADPMPSHHLGYDGQIRTLQEFAERIKQDSAPFIVMAHSMGAHIALRHLHDNPGVFDAAILTAPLLNIQTGKVMPRFVARIVALLMHALGLGARYVPGGGSWDVTRDVFDGNDRTGDPVRFAVQTTAYLANPKLRMGDPTCGWVHETFKSAGILARADYLKSINTPILMEISGDERIVDKKAAQRAAMLLPRCKRVDIEGAKHEIWMERDELRLAWLGAVDAFLAAFAKETTP